MKPRYAFSIVIPTIDETASLTDTVDVLLADGSFEVLEILLVICDRTTRATRAICRRLQGMHGLGMRIVQQSMPLLGGAFRSGIASAAGTHIVLMFADLESNPRTVARMAAAAKSNPDSVISASRWLKGGGFKDYGLFRLGLNYCFQRVCALACGCQLTDFTYGFRLYPAAILKETAWKETDHAFVVESIVRPMLAGVSICEVPALWVPRREGRRRFRLRQYVHYLPTLGAILVNHQRKVNHKPIGQEAGCDPDCAIQQITNRRDTLTSRTK